MKKLLFLAAALPFAVLADDSVPVATTQLDFEWTIDTKGGSIGTVKSAGDFDSFPEITYRAGDTISAAANTLVSEPVANGVHALSASDFTSGGVVTLVRTAQGGIEETATVTVRHSVTGTQGAGTDSDPAKLVDGDELVDYVADGKAGDGYVFTLCGDSLLPSLRLPSGFALAEVGDGTWKIVSSADGCVYDWAGNVEFAMDSVATGPDRKIKGEDAKAGVPFAYSGGRWCLDSATVSSLTLVSPSGVNMPYALSGNGAMSIALTEPGIWHATLVSCNGTETVGADIKVSQGGFMLIVR